MDKAGVQRITLKQLSPQLTNTLIVGIIIAKQTPRFFATKDNESRGVWNCTLRDSVMDYINITVWGSKHFINTLNENIHVGSVVDVINAQITVRALDDRGEQYRPCVTCPFNLTLNEASSNLVLHNGENNCFYQKLLQYPTKPTSGFFTLADVHKNGATVRGDLVDLLVSVKSVGPVRNIRTKDGRELDNRELGVFDQTSLGLNITIWDQDYIKRAEFWKPRQTILFLTDMKVDWNNYQKGMGVFFSPKTVITEDPLSAEAQELRNYAKTAPLKTTDVLEEISHSMPDPSAIKTVMSVQRVKDLAKKSSSDGQGDEAQFTAVVYAILTDFDLDGCISVVKIRCERCGSMIDDVVGICINLECPMGSGAEKPNSISSFDIRATLSDHTGSLPNCRMTGSIAERILGCSVSGFMQMPLSHRENLKWQYLLERCVVRIVVLKTNKRSGPLISIVSCELANPTEVSAKLPFC